LRPGEKLYEELLADSEQTLPTSNPKLRMAQTETVPDEAWWRELESWLLEPEPTASCEIKRRLCRFVPEYSPQPDS
jgi:FlaA1/EpsC-like NDP-sugar epimerase